MTNTGNPLLLAATLKMNRQHRDAESMSDEMARGAAALTEAYLKIQDLEAEIEGFKVGIDKRQCDLDGRTAREAYLMKLLDEAYGSDKNPARQSAYGEDEDFRIPVGDRKGEIVTMADHMYLDAYAESWKKNYAKKWRKYAKTWVEFLNPRISI